MFFFSKLNSYVSVIKALLHLLAYMVSKEKSAIIHVFVPILFSMFFSLPLSVFRILSLSLFSAV